MTTRGNGGEGRLHVSRFVLRVSLLTVCRQRVNTRTNITTLHYHVSENKINFQPTAITVVTVTRTPHSRHTNLKLHTAVVQVSTKCTRWYITEVHITRVGLFKKKATIQRDTS